MRYELQTSYNLTTRQIQLVMLRDGHPVPGASMTFDVDQAEFQLNNWRTAIEAIKSYKPGIIIPAGIGVPFQP